MTLEVHGNSWIGAVVAAIFFVGLGTCMVGGVFTVAIVAEAIVERVLRAARLTNEFIVFFLYRGMKRRGIRKKMVRRRPRGETN